MGGGDLNLKKSWHPGTLKNQTIVWQREQKLIEEQKRLKELRKELEDEREKERLYELQGKRKVRLEWMYSASYADKDAEHISKEKEELLLGKKQVDWSKFEQEAEKQKEFDDTKLSSAYGVNANTDHDFKAKVRDDPLLIFKKQEQEALQLLGNIKDKSSKIKKKSKRDKSNRHEDKDRSSDYHRDREMTRHHDYDRDYNSKYHRDDDYKRQSSRSPPSSHYNKSRDFSTNDGYYQRHRERSAERRPYRPN